MNTEITGIYQIQSKIKPNRIYIGSAVDITNRWASHLSELKKNKHDNGKLQNHYNKYGKDDLLFSIITLCNREELIPINKIIRPEQFFIWAYDPWFNICKKAGSQLGVKRSNITKQKIRNAKIGLKQSDESNKKRSETLLKNENIKRGYWKGKKQSPNTVEKRVSQLRGRKQSSEHIKKRTLSRTNTKYQHRKDYVVWNKGLTKETDSRMKKVSDTLKATYFKNKNKI